ncbi:SsrA-binding protein SmpB [Clostridia bacterium]|nr:SsrA-binding protein SmpB [Clostridia bacterium]
MKTITKNKKARHDYHILETFEAGISLQGTEVKSLRAGRVNLKDSYANIYEGEIYLEGVHISTYEQGSYMNHEPERKRRLLMHKYEIRKLLGKVKEKGLSLVPLSMYFNDHGKVKVELALVKGKKLYDKRHDLAKKQASRDIERAFRDRQK